MFSNLTSACQMELFFLPLTSGKKKSLNQLRYQTEALFKTPQKGSDEP